MYRGNERKEQRELPFDFEEAVLSPKERARIQRGEGAFNPFQTDSKALVVEEFRVSELSARIRTINNARDSMAMLPDGTPLTEVTMYGRRGEVYLLGPFAAVKRVMAGEVPSSLAIRQEIKNARSSLGRSISTLKKGLDQFYDDRDSALSFEACTNSMAFANLVKESRMRAGHSFLIESCAEDIEALDSELPPLEEAIKQWKWWGPWTSEAKDVSERVTNVLGRRDELIKELLVQMAAVPHPGSESPGADMFTVYQLVDGARIVRRSVSGEISRLNGLLDQLKNQNTVMNVTLLGSNTYVCRLDIPSINLTLSNYSELSSDLQQFEQEILGWLKTEDARSTKPVEFEDRLARAKLALENERSAFAGDVLYRDRARTKQVEGTAR